jgi:16S rRNA (cytosine967-C5)-methyltransferase
MPIPSARSVAAAVLVRVMQDSAFAAAALDAEVSRSAQLDPRDRALATELVYGSLRVLPWLTSRLERRAPRGLGGLDARTRAELILSAYQLFFLARVPAFAAVNEAVEAIKVARGAKLAAFANAVLRRISEEAPATRGEGRLFEATWASMPVWLREALARSLGEDGAKAFCAAGLEPPPLGLRVDAEESREGWLAKLRAAVPQATFEPGKASPLAILARGGGRSELWPGSRQGWSVQEEGSQVVALSVGAQPGELVLDACAGRGNKSSLLSHAVGAAGGLDAADVHPNKLARLTHQLAASGRPLRRTFAVDWSVGSGDVDASYDRALVDAPCSGIGTIRRRPDLALRRDVEDLERLAALQASIVTRVAKHVRPGGRLIYAVCSVLTEEAEAVVRRILSLEAGLTLAPFDAAAACAIAGSDPTFRLLPNVQGTDGYFVASFLKDAP